MGSTKVSLVLLIMAIFCLHLSGEEIQTEEEGHVRRTQTIRPTVLAMAQTERAKDEPDKEGRFTKFNLAYKKGGTTVQVKTLEDFEAIKPYSLWLEELIKAAQHPTKNLPRTLPSAPWPSTDSTDIYTHDPLIDSIIRKVYLGQENNDFPLSTAELVQLLLKATGGSSLGLNITIGNQKHPFTDNNYYSIDILDKHGKIVEKIQPSTWRISHSNFNTSFFNRQTDEFDDYYRFQRTLSRKYYAKTVFHGMLIETLRKKRSSRWRAVEKIVDEQRLDKSKNYLKQALDLK